MDTGRETNGPKQVKVMEGKATEEEQSRSCPNESWKNTGLRPGGVLGFRCCLNFIINEPSNDKTPGCHSSDSQGQEGRA